MPEYPEIVVYIEQLARIAQGRRLAQVRIAHPFLLRTAEPPITVIEGSRLVELQRLGKQIVFAFVCANTSEDNDACIDKDTLFLVLHLMISGRLHWRKSGASIRAKRNLAALDFEHGTLVISESSTQKRASLHLVRGRKALLAFQQGGLEILEASLAAFHAAVTAENHTLKRTLTDPRILSGIGNAYSDEILHRARLSPVQLTKNLKDEEIARLYEATRTVLVEWTTRLRAEAGTSLPDRVTAFHPEMAVHGRYNLPCPVCGTSVQRIRYATKETNYCPTCQTGGRLLADRALSRLLKSDWPRTLEELEARGS